MRSAGSDRSEFVLACSDNAKCEEVRKVYECLFRDGLKSIWPC